MRSGALTDSDGRIQRTEGELAYTVLAASLAYQLS